MAPLSLREYLVTHFKSSMHMLVLMGYKVFPSPFFRTLLAYL